MDRRYFLQYMGYGSAGVVMVPALLKGCNIMGKQTNNSTVCFDGIMPISANIDCSRLLLAVGAVQGIYKEMIEGNLNLPLTGNISRLGSSIPFEDNTVLEYFSEFRNEWDRNSETDRKKAALLIGWMMFHPLRRSMSDVYKKLVNQGYHYDIITLYYNTYMLKQVSGDPETIFLEVDELEDFLLSIVPRMVTRYHTLKPDYEDGIGWVNRMSEWRKINRETMHRWANLIIKDDQEMRHHFIERYNVYRPDDRLIQLARSIDKQNDKGLVEKLILSDPGNSIYTKSLVKAYHNVVALQDFFEGNTELQTLKNLL